MFCLRIWRIEKYQSDTICRNPISFERKTERHWIFVKGTYLENPSFVQFGWRDTPCFRNNNGTTGLREFCCGCIATAASGCELIRFSYQAYYKFKIHVEVLWRGRLIIFSCFQLEIYPFCCLQLKTTIEYY